MRASLAGRARRSLDGAGVQGVDPDHRDKGRLRVGQAVATCSADNRARASRLASSRLRCRSRLPASGGAAGERCWGTLAGAGRMAVMVTSWARHAASQVAGGRAEHPLVLADRHGRTAPNRKARTRCRPGGARAVSPPSGRAPPRWRPVGSPRGVPLFTCQGPVRRCRIRDRPGMAAARNRPMCRHRRRPSPPSSRRKNRTKGVDSSQACGLTLATLEPVDWWVITSAAS